MGMHVVRLGCEVTEGVASSCADELVVGVSGVSGVRRGVGGVVDGRVIVRDGSGVWGSSDICGVEVCVTTSCLVSVMLSSRMMRLNRIVCPPSLKITSRDSRKWCKG